MPKDQETDQLCRSVAHFSITFIQQYPETFARFAERTEWAEAANMLADHGTALHRIANEIGPEDWYAVVEDAADWLGNLLPYRLPPLAEAETAYRAICREHAPQPRETT